MSAIRPITARGFAALLACIATFGCSTSTQNFNHPAEKTSTPGIRVTITKLGSQLSVGAAADSWPALVKKVKPAFTWNGRDLLWIQRETNGQPRFILDEAYLYQPANQSRQWVLLNRRDTSYTGTVPDEPDLLRAVATLHNPVPHDDHGGNDYALVIATNRMVGNVYELGWRREMGRGTAHPISSRRIYLLQDRNDRWRFLGEGPEEAVMRGGPNSVTSQVVWDAVFTNQLPFQIRFRCEQLEYIRVSEDDLDSQPDLVTYSEYALAGPFPSQCQLLGGGPYLVAEAADTVEKIIYRLGYNLPGWEARPSAEEQSIEKERVLRMWRTALAELNPDLARSGAVTPGTRIHVLDYAGVFARLKAVAEPGAQALN